MLLPLVLLAGIVTAQDSFNTVPLPLEEQERIESFIRSRNDGIEVFSVTYDSYGRGFDCVPAETQPGLRDRDPNTREVFFRALDTIPDDIVAETQRFSQNPTRIEDEVPAEPDRVSCPPGTVPVKQLSYDVIAGFGSLDAYLARPPYRVAGHEYAVVDLEEDNHGGKAVFNLWNPYVSSDDDFSLSQLWVVRGEGSDLQTVEAVIVDYPYWTESSEPVLGVFYTTANYAEGFGCQHPDCDGWVQVDEELAPPFGWTGFSIVGGTQHTEEFGFIRSTNNGNWYLLYNGGILGYYPHSLFDAEGLGPKASNVAFGGEIYDSGTWYLHTGTDMGSGYFPSSGWQYAAYIRNMQFRTIGQDAWESIPSGDLDERVTDADCYDLLLYSGSSWGTYIYFGGTGFSTNCYLAL